MHSTLFSGSVRETSIPSIQAGTTLEHLLVPAHQRRMLMVLVT